MIKENQIIKYKDRLGKAIHCYGDKESILRFCPVRTKSYSKNDLEIIQLDLVEEATFEDKIRYIEFECPWGRIVKTHCISNIQIVEYHNDKENETGFSVYIDFESTCHGASSLEEAILTGICDKYDCSNALHWILKMLGV